MSRSEFREWKPTHGERSNGARRRNIRIAWENIQPLQHTHIYTHHENAKHVILPHRVHDRGTRSLRLTAQTIYLDWPSCSFSLSISLSYRARIFLHYSKNISSDYIEDKILSKRTFISYPKVPESTENRRLWSWKDKFVRSTKLLLHPQITDWRTHERQTEHFFH